MREISEEMLYTAEQLAEEIIPSQISVKNSLNSLGSIRSRYKAFGSMIPIDYELVSNLIYFLESKEIFSYGVLPSYWNKVINAKSTSSLNQGNVSKINRCLSLLAKEELLIDQKARRKNLASCLSRASKLVGQKQLATFIKHKFIKYFEYEFFGESLIAYASTISLNPDFDDDNQYSED